MVADHSHDVFRSFRSRFGVEPAVGVLTPGRVNLIGEHTDHQLLPVMPLAIDRAIRFAACAVDDGRIEAVSHGHEQAVTLQVADPVADGWGAYVAAAVRALQGHTDLGSRGARIAIDADLPSTGGLSSSAALMVGTLHVLSEAWGLGLRPAELPALAIEAEHALGLESGGMDQTVVALAEAGSALRIEFAPLSSRPVPIPDTIDVIAAYSGQAAHKGAGANVAYNSIIASCRAATLLLARALGVAAPSPLVLGPLARLDGAFDALASLPRATTPAAVAAELGIPVDAIVQLTAKRLPDDLPIDPAVHAGHVVTELARIDAVEAAMHTGDVAALGRLLDDGHASLRLMGTSSDALDTLTAAMRDAGALGARVTGAGFGGYAVAVSRHDRTAAVLAAAERATGGPAFVVRASAGTAVLAP